MPDSVATSESPASAVAASSANVSVERLDGAASQPTTFSPFASVRPCRSIVTVASSANETVRLPPVNPVEVVFHVLDFAERSIVEPFCISHP